MHWKLVLWGVLCFPLLVAAGETASDDAATQPIDWRGVKVLPREPGLRLESAGRDPIAVSDRLRLPARVGTVKGKWLGIRQAGASGWVRADDIVPLTEAEAYYTEYLTRERSAWAHRMRGIARTHLGAHDAAIDDFTQALEIDPAYARAASGRGSVRAMKRDFAGAMEDFARAIELDPGYAAAYHGRGLAQSMLGNYEGAHESFAQALAINPSEAAVFCARGAILARQGELDQAQRDLNEAIRLEPDFAEAFGTRAGAIWIARGELQLAINDLNRAIALDPSWAAAYGARAEIWEKLGEESKAAADLRRAEALSAADRERTAARGTAADDQLRTATYEEPSDVPLRPDAPEGEAACRQWQLAREHCAREAWDEAVVAVDAVLQDEPEFAPAWILRGDLWMRHQRPDGAISAYNRAIELDSESASAFVGRGAARQKKGQYEQALADFQQALMLDPMNVAARTGHGTCLTRLERARPPVAR